MDTRARQNIIDNETSTLTNRLLLDLDLKLITSVEKEKSSNDCGVNRTFFSLFSMRTKQGYLEGLRLFLYKQQWKRLEFSFLQAGRIRFLCLSRSRWIFFRLLLDGGSFKFWFWGSFETTATFIDDQFGVLFDFLLGVSYRWTRWHVSLQTCNSIYLLDILHYNPLCDWSDISFVAYSSRRIETRLLSPMTMNKLDEWMNRAMRLIHRVLIERDSPFTLSFSRGFWSRLFGATDDWSGSLSSRALHTGWQR